MNVAGMHEPVAVKDHSRQDLLRIFEQAKTIAVVGASADGRKSAHAIPDYLRSQGYRVLPVNPRGGEILGERAYPSLEEIDARVDVVDVFRPPTEAETIARQAVAIGADVLWFQPGTHTAEAVILAADAGLTVVAGRCMGAAPSGSDRDLPVPLESRNPQPCRGTTDRRTERCSVRGRDPLRRKGCTGEWTFRLGRVASNDIARSALWAVNPSGVLMLACASVGPWMSTPSIHRLVDAIDRAVRIFVSRGKTRIGA